MENLGRTAFLSACRLNNFSLRREVVSPRINFRPGWAPLASLGSPTGHREMLLGHVDESLGEREPGGEKMDNDR